MKRFLRRFVLAMLLGVVLYGAFVVYAGYREIKQSLGIFHWSAFALALLLATSNYFFRFLKWEYYLARLQIRAVRKMDSLLIFLSGFVLTITPGKVGEVFKSALLLETHGIPAARTAPIVIADRLTDVIGVITLILLGSLGFRGGLLWAMIGAALVVTGLVLILWDAPQRRLLRFVSRGPERVRRLEPKFREAFISLKVLASPSALAWPSLLSVLGWGAEGLALYVLLRGFDSPVLVARAIFFYSTATLAGAIIPVPGGLGVTETMMQEQLVRVAHVAQAPATASMILVRFATLWWAVIVGFLALAALRRRYPSLLKGGEVGKPAVVEADRMQRSANAGPRS